MRLWEFEDFEFGNDELEGEDEGEIICSLFVLIFGLELEFRNFAMLDDDLEGIWTDDAFDGSSSDRGIGGETLLISFLCFTTHGWGFYLIIDLKSHNFHITLNITLNVKNGHHRV